MRVLRSVVKWRRHPPPSPQLQECTMLTGVVFHPNAILPPAPLHKQGQGARHPISPFTDKLVTVTSNLNQEARIMY